MFSLLLIILIYFSFITLGLQDSLLGVAWPSMYGLFNVPLHYAGILAIILAAGTVVASLLSARINRYFNTGIVAAASVIMTAAALIGFSFSNLFYMLCIFAVPMGFGAGLLDASINNYVALHYKARHMSWLHCFWGVGASIGPVLMSMFLIHRNWNSGYRTISIIQLCVVVLLFLSLSLWKKNDEPEKLKNKNPLKIPGLIKIPGVKYALLTFFCYCTIESTTGLWGASYLVTVRGISSEIAARWVALYYMGITAGRFLSGFVTMKFNNRQMIRLGQISIASGIVLIILPVGNTMLLPGLFLIGLGCAPIFPCMIHQTPVNFGRENSQAIIGLQMASAYAGIALMPPLFGRIASLISFNLYPVFIGILLIIKIVLAELLNKKVKREDNVNPHC